MTQLISLSKVPSLDSYEVESVDLNAEYWTPEKDGETRRMIFMGVHDRTCPDHNDPEKEVELPCAVFVEPHADGPRTVTNASKRLVATFENTKLESGTPCQIIYRGKKKNRTNGNMSDAWSVQTLRAKQ